jgi:ABC-2 type transport system permease protein
MRKAFRIAQREYRATVKTKGFIIGLVLAPVVMGGSGIAMALLEDRVDHEDKMIAVVDRSGLLAESLVRAAAVRTERDVYDAESGEQLRAAYGIQVVQPARDYDVLLGLSDRVRSGDLHAIVEISEGVLHPRRDGAAARIGYYAQNPAMDDVRNWVGRQLNDELRRLRLDHAGVDQSALPDLFDWIQPEPLRPVSIDPETGAIGDAERSSELEALLIPIIPTVLMFLMLMMGAVPQLQAVTEEKAQRIAEVMLGSVRPFEFMLGKLMGGVGVSLTAATVYVVGGVAAIRIMELGQYIPYHVLPWFFVYVVAAVFMVGALQAALGSACNDASEAQSVRNGNVVVPAVHAVPHVVAASGTGGSRPVATLGRLSRYGGVHCAARLGWREDLQSGNHDAGYPTQTGQHSALGNPRLNPHWMMQM